MTDIVASLAVEIGAEIGGWQTGLGQVQSGIMGIGPKITGLGSQITAMGAQIGLAFAPLTAAMGGGIKVASDFETIMAEIGARAGLTGDELGAIQQFALDMGAETAFSAQQAAEGLLQLLTSGQNVEQAMATLPAVLDAAAASGADLGQTADNITDIMAAFGLDVDDATGVVDALARAAGASSADMPGLAQGFANVGGVANQFGLSVEQTAAALALLSENGIKGAEAGTALKSMLLNMSRDTEDTLGAWNELGTSLYDAEGNLRNLPTVLQEVEDALATRTAEDQNNILKDLFGSYGILAGTALTGAVSIDDMQSSMEGATGASDVAAARMDTFSGKVDTLIGSLETLAITTLTPLMNDVLKPLAETLTEVVNGVILWADENPELAGTLTQVLAGLAIAGPGLMLVGGIIKGVGAAATLALSPIGLLALAVLGLKLLLDQPWIQEGLAAWTGVFENLEIIWGEIWGRIQTAWNEKVVQPLTGLKEDIETALGEVGSWIDINVVQPIVAIADNIAAGLENFKNAIKGPFEWVENHVLKPFLDIINDIVAGIEAITGYEGGGGLAGDTADAFLAAHPPSGTGGSAGLGSGALGGYAPAGGPILVGEQGPEMFFPNTGGTIVPNHKLGGGSNYNITVYGSSPHELAKMIEMAMKERDL